jgi:hypothetical protein
MVDFEADSLFPATIPGVRPSGRGRTTGLALDPRRRRPRTAETPWSSSFLLRRAISAGATF